MYLVKLKITLDGRTFEEVASGNTRRTAETAALSVARSFELDGAEVQVGRPFAER